MKDLDQNMFEEMEQEETKEIEQRIVKWKKIARVLMIVSVLQMVLTSILMVVAAIFLHKKLQVSKEKFDETKKVIIKNLLEKYSE